MIFVKQENIINLDLRDYKLDINVFTRVTRNLNFKRVTRNLNFKSFITDRSEASGVLFRNVFKVPKFV